MRNTGKEFARRIKGRDGSYIVEAAVTLPLFLIAVLVMSSVILMYACIESCSFIAANELRMGSAEAVFADTGILIPYRLKTHIRENFSQVESARTIDYGFRTSRWGQDELILVTMNLKMRTKNPAGIRAAASYDLGLVTRAYVGKIRDVESMTDGEMSGEDAVPVFIFPKRGEKYHSKGCTFLRAASTSTSLTDSMRRKYRACPLCHSSGAANGALVYYFPSDGEDYHLPGCASLQRNYIEIDKGTARRRGYTACSKCGG
jgi:hypothetical protein